jgi:hypothetical protein
MQVTIHNYQSKVQSTPATPMVKGDAFGGMGYGFPPHGTNEPFDATRNFKSVSSPVRANRALTGSGAGPACSSTSRPVGRPSWNRCDSVAFDIK